MTVYVLIHEDRHTDVDVQVFTYKDAAIHAAMRIVMDYDFEDDEPLTPLPKEWLFHANLSHEDDWVSVRETETQ